MERPQAPLTATMLESICRILADTDNGLSGTEIARILQQENIQDISPGITKWKRLYDALANCQSKLQSNKGTIRFIQVALSPILYIGKEEVFQFRRHEINKRLSMIGLELTESGKYRLVEKTSTISEAEQRASKLKYILEVRKTHETVLLYCKSELLVDNYFHSVFEATKSIADRIRNMTGLYADGNALVDIAFSTSTPLVKINFLRTDTDRSEHIGLSNLIKGIFGVIRNPTAHTPKITFPIDENEAVDILTTISYIHKRLDKVI